MKIATAMSMAVLGVLSVCSVLAAEAVPKPEGVQEGVPYVHIVTDAKGESHFEDGVMPLNFVKTRAGDVAGMHSEELAGRSTYMLIAPGTFEDWHPSPASQILVVIQGEVEVGVSDGKLRRLTPGMVMVMDDFTGKGHTTRTIGKIPHIALMLPKAVKK